MKRKHVQSLLSAWHKRLHSATLDMHDMQENVRQSNLQLVFCRLFITLVMICESKTRKIEYLRGLNGRRYVHKGMAGL